MFKDVKSRTRQRYNLEGAADDTVDIQNPQGDNAVASPVADDVASPEEVDNAVTVLGEDLDDVTNQLADLKSDTPPTDLADDTEPVIIDNDDNGDSADIVIAGEDGDDDIEDLDSSDNTDSTYDDTGDADTDNNGDDMDDLPDTDADADVTDADDVEDTDNNGDDMDDLPDTSATGDNDSDDDTDNDKGSDASTERWNSLI